MDLFLDFYAWHEEQTGSGALALREVLCGFREIGICRQVVVDDVVCLTHGQTGISFEQIETTDLAVQAHPAEDLE